MLRMCFIFMLLLPGLASAQSTRLSHCVAVAGLPPGEATVQRADWRDPVAESELRISYVGHSTFLIQTASGVSAATDFTGSLGSADHQPDVVTMNHAHSSHWTPVVDPRVKYVLRGWPDEPGGENRHNLEVGEMLIRNVHTDIRYDFSVEENGNSIFIFEAEGLCIGHLGHLHHEPDEAQYAAIGRVDVLLAAVDGGLTLDIPSMIRIAKRLKSSVVIPMHWFGRGPLEQFLTGMEDEFAILRSDESYLELSLSRLPARPTVFVLEPRPLQ